MIAEKVKDRVEKMLKSELLTCFEEDSITTQIYDSKTFYLAKLEDQKYIKNA